MGSTCEFVSFLKRALCDKFVCGLKDDKVQEKLLFEDKLLEEAVKMAKAMELATANVAHMKEKETNEVNKMCAESNAFELQKKKMCFGCGGKWHERRSQCPAWGKMCSKCNNKNHFSRHCKNKQRGNMWHYIQETHDMLLLSTRYNNYKPYTCKLELNGVQCDSDKQDSLTYYHTQNSLKRGQYWGYRPIQVGVIILNGIANLKVKYQGKMYAVRGGSIMEKTCRSYSCEYSNRTCRERLRSIQATSRESGTNSYKALNICCTASCTLQR